MLSNSRAVVAFVAALALFGCKGSAVPPPATQTALTVADIDVGRSLAADKTIADKTDVFRPADTFYVAVKTVGSAPTAAARASSSCHKLTDATAPGGIAVSA